MNVFQSSKVKLYAGQRLAGLVTATSSASDIVGFLNHADGVAGLLEDFADFFPAGTVHEATVDENYCLYSRIRFAVHNISFLCFVVCLLTVKSVMPPNENGARWEAATWTGKPESANELGRS
jgi:hypothetical protein